MCSGWRFGLPSCFCHCWYSWCWLFWSPATFPAAGVSPELVFCHRKGCFSLWWSWVLLCRVSGFFCCLLLSHRQWLFWGFAVAAVFWFLSPWSLVGLLLLSAGFLLLFSIMYASLRVEGKFREVGGGGGPFPLKIAESSRRKRSFIRLSFQELR